MNRILNYSKQMIFESGEMAQLTAIALNYAANQICEGKEEEIVIEVPVGYFPDKKPILSKRKFTKGELVNKYNYLAHNQLSINGTYHLITIMEAMLNDLLYQVILKYPKKINEKKMVSARSVLSSGSVEELYINTIYSILNELSFKTPKEYAEGFKYYTSVNLLECADFHKYIEVKATRDVLIHNRGIANEVYESKAGTHARVKAGQLAPVNQIYYLESYEACLQVIEWLEIQLNDVWHSQEYEAKIGSNIAQQKAQADVDGDA